MLWTGQAQKRRGKVAPQKYICTGQTFIMTNEKYITFFLTRFNSKFLPID